MELIDKLRDMLFSFLTSTFGERVVKFLGFFMTGFLGLADGRDEFFFTLDDAVSHAKEQRHLDDTPYTNDEMREYVDSIMEVWARNNGYRLTRAFIHQCIAVSVGNLAPVAMGAGAAVTKILGEEAGRAASAAIENKE